MEQWLPIAGFEQLYEVSSIGRIRTIAGRIRGQRRDKDGYHLINLFVGQPNGRNKTITRRVARLVASAFLGPIPSGWEVNHLNFDRADDRLENLEIISAEANRLHAKVNGRETAPRLYKVTAEQVAQLRSRHERGELTIQSAAREYGIGCTECRRILNYERWRTLTSEQERTGAA